MLAHDVPRGVDEHQCGPGAARVLLPHFELSIVDHRVFKLIAPDSLINIVSRFLVRELGRMDPDDGQFVGVFLFQSPQLRKNMRAVDSTICPEVQNDNPALKLLKGQWSVYIDPLQVLRKFRRCQLPSERLPGHCSSGISNRPAAQIAVRRPVNMVWGKG